MIPYFHALFIQRHGMISALMIYGQAGLQSPVLEFDKNCTRNAYFLQKVDVCIFEPTNREVIDKKTLPNHRLALVHYNTHTSAKIHFNITRA